MNWIWDIAQPQTQALIAAQAKLNALAGNTGAVFDVAYMNECFAPSTRELFRTFLANRGALDRSLAGSVDPNDQVRRKVADEAVSAIGGDEAIAGFDLLAFIQENGEYGWTLTPVYKNWELFKAVFIRHYMSLFRADMAQFTSSLGLPDFITFFNQGETNLFDTEKQGSVIIPIKDISGSETFISSAHPTQGYNDCTEINGGSAYPVNRTLELIYAMSDTDGRRFWSWNAPGLPDDRPHLFAAETLANGGILQYAGSAVDAHYPLGGYTRPGLLMRLISDPMSAWMTKQWANLNKPRAVGQIAFYFPQTLCAGCYSGGYGHRGAQLFYRAMLSLHYTVDVLGRSGFDMGYAQLPSQEELSRYDFIVLVHTFLSDEEIKVLETYVYNGGTILLYGTPGANDEWGAYMPERTYAGKWATRFSAHGKNTYGSGSFYQLDGVTAWNGVNASSAFEELSAPNQGVEHCGDSPALVVNDVHGEREKLFSWLEAQITAWNLPVPAAGQTLPFDIHIVAA